MGFRAVSPWTKLPSCRRFVQTLLKRVACCGACDFGDFKGSRIGSKEEKSFWKGFLFSSTKGPVHNSAQKSVALWESKMHVLLNACHDLSLRKSITRVRPRSPDRYMFESMKQSHSESEIPFQSLCLGLGGGLRICIGGGRACHHLLILFHLCKQTQGKHLVGKQLLSGLLSDTTR